jgi:hypothetical protein
MTDEEKIKANAQVVIEGLGPAATELSDFGFNRESVEWVDGYIERQRKRGGTKEQIDSLISVIGSFYGECIIQKYGGKWGEFDGQMGVIFGEKPPDLPMEEEIKTQTEEEALGEASTVHAVFPFSKVYKQFQQGRKGGESILSFYDLIGPMLQGPQVKRFH